jgi:primosomal protein N' (replication factor Y)
MYATVVFPAAFPEPLTYSIPGHLRGVVREGSRVVVPLARSRSFGVVADIRAKPDLPPGVEIREIADCLDAEPLIGRDMLALTKWVASYYMSSWGEALRAALPGGLIQREKQQVRRTEDGEPGETELSVPVVRRLWESLSGKPLDVEKLARRHTDLPVRSLLARWSGAGFVRLTTSFRRRVPTLTARWLRLPVETAGDGSKRAATVNSLKTRAPKQALLVDRLSEHGPTPRSVVCGVWGVSSSVVDAAVNKGLVEQFTQPLSRDPLAGWSIPSRREYELTDAQQSATDRIAGQSARRSYAAFLLDGVAGSGKTDVYLAAADVVLGSGLGVLVLVPEIALATQTVLRFRARFGSRVALWHSGLSDGERLDTWLRILRREHDVVVGARLAVFSPIPKCGLIIVDEEHAESYKQSETAPRYHARDLAVIRAKQSAAVCVLGSATPSFESYENARRGKYVHLRMPDPAPGRVRPSVEVVDLRAERDSGNKTALSRRLIEKLKQTKRRGEQAILFLNRRGFARLVRCSECGYALSCPNCAITLTFHRSGRVRCHYCNYSRAVPDACPACGSRPMVQLGTGTQKAEDHLDRFRLGLRTARMDRDTTSRKHAHRDLLDAFGSGEYDVLVGTQMVAKGLDFPKVTLVGVLRADDGLDFADFRARERTFQLLYQVAGRAGRSEAGGSVVVQTYSPGHPVIAAAVAGERDAFYERELALREEHGYPPYTHLCLVTATASSESLARRVASRALSIMREEAVRLHLSGVRFLGPASAPLPKLKRKYREQVLVKAPAARDVNLIVSALRSRPVPGASRLARLSVDVDPHDLM